MVCGKFKQRRDHRYAQENLSAYLDGELAAGEMARVEAHLRRCPNCQQELRSLRETALLLRCAPQRAVPRSFALPASAGRAQARYRRWQVSYGLVRTASVAVALLLVMLLSAEALLSAGLVSLPTHSVAREQMRVVLVAPPEAPVSDAAAPAMAPAPTEALIADKVAIGAASEGQPLAVATPEAAITEAAPFMAQAVEATPEASVAEAILAEPVSEPATTPAPTSQPEVIFAQPGLGGAAPQPSALRGASPEAGDVGGVGGAGGPAAGGMGAGGEGGAAPDMGAAGEGEGPAPVLAEVTRPTPPLDSSAVQRVVAPTPTPAESAVMVEQAQAPTAPLTALEAPTAATPAPEEAPLAMSKDPTAAAPAPAVAAPAAPAEVATIAPETRVERHTVVTQEVLPAAWRLWQALRVAAGGLLGLLLMLVAGLLWLGQRRPF